MAYAAIDWSNHAFCREFLCGKITHFGRNNLVGNLGSEKVLNYLQVCFRQGGKGRFCYSLVKTCGTLNIDVSSTVIYLNLKVRKFAVFGQTSKLPFLVKGILGNEIGN